MSSDFKSKKLREVIELVIDNRGKNPKEYSSTGIPVIDNYLITSDGEVNLDEVNRFIDENTYNSFLRKYIQHGDVLMTLVGNGYGKVAITPKEKCAIIQNTIGFRCNNDNSNKFLYYLLRNNREIFMNLNRGAAQPSIKVGDILEVEFQFPSKTNQEDISSILVALDDRIALLRETNTTLEAIAQALFKSWFVDFDPVLAKAEGKVPEGIDAATAALFPDEFEETELGMLPRGWAYVPFGELISQTIGGDWGSDVADEKNDTRVAIIRGTDIPDLQGSANNCVPIRFTTQKKLATRKLEDGDLVLEVSGGSKDQPTGRSLHITAALLEKFDCPVEPASFCRLMRPVNKQIGSLLSQHLNYIYAQGKTWEYQNQSTGIANFQTTHFLQNEMVVYPTEAVLNAFVETVQRLIDRTQTLEVQMLSNLRDTLLPRLISGQLRIADAEAELEKATA